MIEDGLDVKPSGDEVNISAHVGGCADTGHCLVSKDAEGDEHRGEQEYRRQGRSWLADSGKAETVSHVSKFHC